MFDIYVVVLNVEVLEVVRLVIELLEKLLV